MGRHRWTSRFTVDECLALDVEVLRRSGAFACPPGTVCITGWPNSSGGIRAMLGFVLVSNPDGDLGVWIDSDRANTHRALKLPGKYLVPIATTRPHLGGRRFWFRCPVVRDGKPCGKLARRLYLPPEGQVFACRDCHNLTYESVQRHDQRKYNLARDLVALDAVLNAALSGPSAKRVRLAFLGIGGLAQMGRWFCQRRMRQLARVRL